MTPEEKTTYEDRFAKMLGYFKCQNKRKKEVYNLVMNAYDMDLYKRVTHGPTIKKFHLLKMDEIKEILQYIARG